MPAGLSVGNNTANMASVWDKKKKKMINDLKMINANMAYK